MRKTKFGTKKHVYGFKDRLKAQAEFCKRFKTWLGSRPDIRTVESATREQEFEGIDLRAYTNSGIMNVQLKTDFNAHRTRNVCFETISQAYPDRNGVLGWGFKLHSVDWLVWLIAGCNYMFFLRPERVVDWVIENYDSLENFSVENPEYVSLGVLIPIWRLRTDMGALGHSLPKGGQNATTN